MVLLYGLWLLPFRFVLCAVLFSSAWVPACFNFGFGGLVVPCVSGFGVVCSGGVLGLMVIVWVLLFQGWYNIASWACLCGFRFGVKHRYVVLWLLPFSFVLGWRGFRVRLLVCL